MKKALILTFASMLFLGIFVQQAAAQQQNTYNVTANYGVRINAPIPDTDTCEEVGNIAIAPQVWPAGGQTWHATNMVTIELLANNMLCRNILAVYGWDAVQDRPVLLDDFLNGNDAYPNLPVPAADLGTYSSPTITAREGEIRQHLSTFANTFYLVVGRKAAGVNDYIRVYILNDFGIPAIEEVAAFVRLGHDVASRLCVNLRNTPYEGNNPNLQLVQASYRDMFENSFSGDQYIATVKPRTQMEHSFGVCKRRQGTWSVYDGTKGGLPMIPLCEGPVNPDPQNQQVACGCYDSGQSICLFVTDDPNPDDQFQVNDQVTFTLGRTGQNAKVGIGFNNVAVYHATDIAMANPMPIANTVRYDRNGNMTADPCDTTQIQFTATLTAGPGTYYIMAGVSYDTCSPNAATPGDWYIDVSMLIGAAIGSCGIDTFAQNDLHVAVITDCEGNQVFTERLFPYVTNDIIAGGSWWAGMALTNPNADAVTINFTAYEADGDTYTSSMTLNANALSVGLLPGFLNATTAGADQMLGDEYFWIRAEATAPFQGFLMMGDSAQAQGYLAVPNN